MVGGGSDPQWGKGLPWHWNCGGDVEGSGGNFKSPDRSPIIFRDFLHGFRVGCGTSTITLKSKLLQQLAALREEVLYVNFL